MFRSAPILHPYPRRSAAPARWPDAVETPAPSPRSATDGVVQGTRSEQGETEWDQLRRPSQGPHDSAILSYYLLSRTLWGCGEKVPALPKDAPVKEKDRQPAKKCLVI